MQNNSSELYTVEKQIGKGAYGVAYIAKHKNKGSKYVLKKVKLARQSHKERQASLKELLILSNLQHRNVLKFVDAWVEAGCVSCMVVELCESGDLLSQLKLRVPNQLYFHETHLHQMLVQLAAGLSYLHNNNIVHRDIKSSNVFVTEEGCLKLADFGLATILDADSPLTSTMVGTPNYMCPEMLKEQPYGIKNDIWALGCIMFELSALKPAFQAFNMDGLVKKITTGPTPNLPHHYSEEWKAVVRSMLCKEEDQRPTADDILRLPWLLPAVASVNSQYGPELPSGAEEFVIIKELPPPIARLADQFRRQEREAELKAAEQALQVKEQQAKFAPRALKQRAEMEKAEAIKAVEAVRAKIAKEGIVLGVDVQHVKPVKTIIDDAVITKLIQPAADKEVVTVVTPALHSQYKLEVRQPVRGDQPPGGITRERQMGAGEGEQVGNRAPASARGRSTVVTNPNANPRISAQTKPWLTRVKAVGDPESQASTSLEVGAATVAAPRARSNSTAATFSAPRVRPNIQMVTEKPAVRARSNSTPNDSSATRGSAGVVTTAVTSSKLSKDHPIPNSLQPTSSSASRGLSTVINGTSKTKPVPTEAVAQVAGRVKQNNAIAGGLEFRAATDSKSKRSSASETMVISASDDDEDLSAASTSAPSQGLRSSLSVTANVGRSSLDNALKAEKVTGAVGGAVLRGHIRPQPLVLNGKPPIPPAAHYGTTGARIGDSNPEMPAEGSPRKEAWSAVAAGSVMLVSAATLHPHQEQHQVVMNSRNGTRRLTE
ncbi:hypothetical protein CEUSTIGMA_g1068.t1 [Chlamydomonas eustigma]|uniref:Protein kinase domain-containing protein n=1 Tax=Chlamydomonas eustigma TaxID=1157962 RepID=A0A250WRY8_9CHLO|nr:hypothetical protein CEUSTIGMA_g1068.t1 [Chlamydomonas eustigma]|eukprot:GAX73617.1 hypothetical protein CEUSTIGMA_g1068.t1 [Chlamydomonas eustigma]